MDLQLLTRPKCYRNSAIEGGPANAWPCYYFRKVNSLPRFRFGGSMSVQRSQLYLKSKFPDTDFLIDLVSIGYIESDSTLLDIRGCHFRLMISLGEFCENVRDWLRVVVLRSRVPHTLLGRKLDWQGLAKSLGLWNGVSIIVGCIIGSGIFVSPTGVHEKAGSVGVSLLVWVSSGLFAAIGAYCYAELGTLIRKSGGDYGYIMEAFGPFLAFLRLWIEAIVVRPCTATIVAITFAIYMLRPFFPDCPPPDGTIQLLAAVLLLILTAINALSVRIATFVMDFFTLAKIFALCCIIGTGAFVLCTGNPKYYDSFDNVWEGTAKDFQSVSLAFYSGLFAYQGWNYLNFIVEELQNPKRNLPLAIIISCSLCTIVYTLTNIALYTVVSPDEMLASPAVAILFAEKMYGKFSFIMPIFVAFSTIGSANGVIFTSSRLFYVGAREGQMPRVLTMINKQTRTPVPAVLFTGFLSLLYLGLSNNVFSLINYIQIVYWIAIGAAMVALLWFRRTMPDAPRPIKVPILFPLVFLFGCCALVVLPIIADPKETAIGILIMLSGVPVYLIFLAWKSKPKFFQTFTDGMTNFCQKLFLVVDDEKQE